MSAVLAVQAAIAVALAEAPAVLALLGPDRVFDETPSRERPPYVYFGAVNRQRREDGFVRAWTIRLRLYVVTDERGRSDAWAIADAIADALDETELVLEAPFAAADIVRAVQAGDVVDPGSDKTVFLDLSTTIEHHPE